MRRLSTFLAALLLATGLAGALLVLLASLPVHERPRDPGLAVPLPGELLGVHPEPIADRGPHALEASAERQSRSLRLEGGIQGLPEGTELLLRRLDGPAGEFLTPVRLDAGGRFAAADLVPGRYEVTWRDQGGRVRNEGIVLDRDLRLPTWTPDPAPSQSLRILAAEGETLAAGAQVLLFDETGRFVRGRTDAEGRVDIGIWTAGRLRYEVRGRTADGVLHRYEGELELDGRTRSLRLGTPLPRD